MRKRKRMKNKEWMTDDILQMVDQRRFKNTDKRKYKRINRKIHKEVRSAKDIWMQKKCTVIETLQVKQKLFITSHPLENSRNRLSRQTEIQSLMDKDGNLTTTVVQKWPPGKCTSRNC